MKKAVIFLNGDKADVSRVKDYINDKTLIIGCDGGTQHAIDLGITPHVVLGDMDSISVELKKKLEKKNVKFIFFPTKKDNTDAELALFYAIEQGCKEIIICGILGTRIDHMLATIHMLANPKFKNIQLRIIEGNQDMFIVHKKISVKGKKGDLLSIIPLANVKGVTTKNLEYPLVDTDLSLETTRGISNVFTKNKAEISFKKGTLLITHTHKSK